MSLLNNATPAAAPAAAPAEAPADAPAANPPAAAPASEGTVFTVEKFGEAMKNPDVLKDGKLFGIWPNFEEAAKGVSNLQGKLREKAPEVPESYDFSNVVLKDKPDVKVDLESPVTKAMLPAFKDAGLSQKQAEVLASAFLQYETGSMINPQDEMKKLGPNAKVMIDNVATHAFAKAPDNMKEAIKAVTATAEGVMVIDWLLAGRTEGAIPVESDAGAVSKTSQEWFDEAQKYKADHKDTISADAGQQKRYMELMRKGAEVKTLERQRQKS